MSDLGAYASLLYTATLTGAMKIVYTIVVAFALMASLHGVHTRAIIILDMQEVLLLSGCAAGDGVAVFLSVCCERDITTIYTTVFFSAGEKIIYTTPSTALCQCAP